MKVPVKRYLPLEKYKIVVLISLLLVNLSLFFLRKVFIKNFRNFHIPSIFFIASFFIKG